MSNGTVAGTRTLANIAQEIVTNDSNPSYTDVNGALYFAADDGVLTVTAAKTSSSGSSSGGGGGAMNLLDLCRP